MISVSHLNLQTSIAQVPPLRASPRDTLNDLATARSMNTGAVVAPVVLSL
jgi:hypothetical protein